MNKFKKSAIFAAIISSWQISNAALPLDQFEKFKSGALTIETSFFNTAYTGSDELKKLIEESKWEDLAEKSVGKKFEANIYYYLLGRAAEGLGHIDAAEIYYKKSLHPKVIDCKGYVFGDGCMGFKFPGESQERLKSLATLPTTNSHKGVLSEWNIGNGPNITDVTIAKNVSIGELKSINTTPAKLTKGKFETDEEYQKRLSNDKNKSATSYLMTFKLPTSDSTRCKTSYNHEKSEYIIEGCALFPIGTPFYKENTLGEPLVLANLVDKREIKRLQSIDYYFDFKYLWTARYNVEKNKAAEIDDDLYGAIQFSGFEKKSSCSMCDSRDTKESLSNLMSSVSALQGKKVDTSDVDWKKDAFRKGAIEEDWIYRFRPTNVEKVFIFTKKDGKLLHEFKFE